MQRAWRVVAKQTPVVDGGGIKLILEPLLLRRLVDEGKLEIAGKRVLLMSGVDRPGMAVTFPALGARVVYGDLLFAVGIPVAITSLRQLSWLAATFLPILRRLPMSVLYPTGSAQEKDHPEVPQAFRAGRHHRRGFSAYSTVYARRPDGEDRRYEHHPKRRCGAVTPTQGRATHHHDTDNFGESFGANVMEAVLVALSGKRPESLTEDDYRHWAEQMKLAAGSDNFLTTDCADYTDKEMAGASPCRTNT